MTIRESSDRFWLKVERNQSDDDCWIWSGSTNRYGYGRFSLEGKNRHAHRVAWMLTNGSIPEERCVLHRCDNPPCVNPNHLFLGSIADNNADMIRKGRNRQLRGECNGRAKISEAQAREIKNLCLERGLSRTSAAKKFGLSAVAVSYLVLGKNWRHLVS